LSLEILAYESTSLGVLCLRRRELLSRPGTVVTEVTLDHEFLMSSYLTESETALATIGVELVRENAEQRELKVLVGGLGLGYTAAAALKSDDVDSVEVVEFLPQVIGWMERGLVPLSDQLNTESRLSISNGDIYARLAEPASQQFDLIAIDVDHSPEDVLGGQSEGFYSVAGLEAARQHLTPGGVLGVWSYAESTPLLENMKTVFADVRVEQVTVTNDLIDEEQTDWLFFGKVQFGSG
jgi:spermidine synthase